MFFCYKDGHRQCVYFCFAFYVMLRVYERTLLTHYFRDRFDESLWRLKGGGDQSAVTREMLLIALQNTQHVLIRATEAVDTQQAT